MFCNVLIEVCLRVLGSPRSMFVRSAIWLNVRTYGDRVYGAELTRSPEHFAWASADMHVIYNLYRKVSTRRCQKGSKQIKRNPKGIKRLRTGQAGSKGYERYQKGSK